MKRIISIIMLGFLIPSIIARADESIEKPEVIVVYKESSFEGKPDIKQFTAALVNMDEITNGPSDNCNQMIGLIKVEGVQFSESGITLESFRFTDANGNQWSVPTNIGKLSNTERQLANNFIRVGRTYFAHVQACGSGGYPSLISLYDPLINFGS